jgi:hypothetical protein
MNNLDRYNRPVKWHGRSYRRFALAFPVRLKYQTESITAEIETVSQNLSIGGLLVRSASPVPQYTTVSFVLSVHGSHAVRPIHLQGEGQVVRIENGQPDGTFVMAVKCNAPVTQLEEFLPM